MIASIGETIGHLFSVRNFLSMISNFMRTKIKISQINASDSKSSKHARLDQSVSPVFSLHFSSFFRKVAIEKATYESLSIFQLYLSLKVKNSENQ